MIEQDTIRDLLIAHRIVDDDVWGNITCGCGRQFYGGDNIEAVMEAQKEYNEHLLVKVTAGVNAALKDVVSSDRPGDQVPGRTEPAGIPTET